MKHLSFLISAAIILTFACKPDTPVNTIEAPIKKVVEKPKKKIEEQFSSTESVIKEELKQAEPSKTEASKPAEANPQEAQPVFVKEVTVAEQVKPAKKVVPQKKVRAAYPEIEFEDLLFDFGEIVQGDKVDHKFVFKNTGYAPLTILKADATCGCASPSIPFMDILPGESGYIGVNYNSVGKEGEETPQVTIFTNAKTNPNIVLKLKGTVKLPEDKEKEEASKSIIVPVKDTTLTTAKDTTKAAVDKNQ